MGPLIKMSLPSFSGCTEYNPQLLKYSCQIECRVKAVSPAKVLAQTELEIEKQQEQSLSKDGEVEEIKRNLSISVMMSKPILALEFNCLKMLVEPPVVVLLPPH